MFPDVDRAKSTAFDVTDTRSDASAAARAVLYLRRVDGLRDAALSLADASPLVTRRTGARKSSIVLLAFAMRALVDGLTLKRDPGLLTHRHNIW